MGPTFTGLGGMMISGSGGGGVGSGSDIGAASPGMTDAVSGIVWVAESVVMSVCGTIIGGVMIGLLFLD